MTIRLMRPEDYAAAHALWTATPGMGLRDEDDCAQGIGRFLQRNPATCFVAEESGRLVGTILGGNDGRRGFIYHLAVEPACRGRGMGRALAQAALAALRKEGITKVALVAFRDNETGNRFWQAMGFTVRADLCYRDLLLDESPQRDSVTCI